MHPDELVSRYLQPSATADQSQAIIQELSQWLHQEPQKNLLLLIQAGHLGLTSESDPTRASANRLLSELVATLIHSNSISKHQVNLLVDFFVEKLGDGPLIVVEALAGLRSLSRAESFSTEHATKCCDALFQNLSIRDLDQPKRLTVLMLMDNLLAYHRETLKNMGSHFLSGYCALVEGEKDPRNLVVAFRLAKVILTEFDLGDQAESLFDITFCYFPITFRPPPGNPDAYGGITAEELTQGLIDCLSATPQFGILVLPLLLEKFQAPGLAPKAQVLQTVIQAFPVYGQVAVAEFASLFWESFLVEIFQPNTSPSQDCLRLLEQGCQTLFSTVFPSDPEVASPSGPIDFIKQALEVIMKELHSPEKSRAVPATRLVAWIIESHANLTDVILPTIHTSMGTLLHLWKGISSGNGDDILLKRTSILGHLSTIFGSISVATTNKNTPVHLSTSQWLTSSTRHEILTILIKEVLENEICIDPFLRVAALRTLVKFVGIPDTLEMQEARDVIGTITRLLVSSNNNEITNAVLENLSTLADTHPADVASVTLPALFSQLPATNSCPPEGLSTPTPDMTSAEYITILSGLATLCDRATLFEPFLVRLLDALQSSCDAAFQSSVNDFLGRDNAGNQKFDAHKYSHHLLLCLHTVIQSKIDSFNVIHKSPASEMEEQAITATQARGIIGRLFEILLCERQLSEIAPTSESELFSDINPNVVRERCTVRNDKRLVIDAGRIVNSLIGQLDFQQQQDFIVKLYQCYNSGNVSEIIEESRHLPSASSNARSFNNEARFSPMSVDAPDPDKNMLALYSEALVAIRPGINVPGEFLSCSDFFTFKYYHHISQTGSSNLVALQASLRLLCSTVNRRAEDFEEFFGEQLDEFWNSHIEHGGVYQTRSRKLAIEMWVWIVKGLVVRSDPRGYKMLDRICGLLKEDVQLGGWIAQRLAVVVDQKDETLSPKNFAVIKFLSKQRAGHYLIGRFVQDYTESDGDSRSVYLVGLSNLLARVGSTVCSLQHDKIVPLLLEALKLSDLNVKLDSLVTIHDLIDNDKRGTVFENHLSSLVSALLLSCTFGRGGTNDEDKAKTPNSSAGVTSASVRLFALKILSLLPSKAGHRSDPSTNSSPAPSLQASNVAKGILLGQRSKVLIALSTALDDPKRDVRKIAVDCRAHWFSLNLT
ncbi:hypothetical protein Pst134EA_003310 [Puccinia striiformis f. sp. tritici]|uniref:hypothetical protein n=1 Tax=Puccinia striiformis f. sp. tritici TaxID=168172 RepID=UPI0020088984|nr:hypothetical protein Pst134EA_003310 [Puccinia striiformis f. sp. tritici]KAH9472703.1 hypothetical protein Pst134EA_003310 [Puccinia striiformis f. sp. tritici]